MQKNDTNAHAMRKHLGAAASALAAAMMYAARLEAREDIPERAADYIDEQLSARTFVAALGHMTIDVSVLERALDEWQACEPCPVPEPEPEPGPKPEPPRDPQPEPRTAHLLQLVEPEPCPSTHLRVADGDFEYDVYKTARDGRHEWDDDGVCEWCDAERDTDKPMMAHVGFHCRRHVIAAFETGWEWWCRDGAGFDMPVASADLVEGTHEHAGYAAAAYDNDHGGGDRPTVDDAREYAESWADALEALGAFS